MSNIDKEALRLTHLEQSEAIKDKQRHGFFSVPITNAIGDDGPYKTKLRIFIIHLRSKKLNRKTRNQA